MGYVIKIEEFEGPLEVLLEFIRKRKMDIQQLQLSPITQDYLHYLSQLQENQIEIASEFMEMASFLLHAKSSSLFHQDEEKAEDAETEGSSPKEALIHTLMEYQAYKEAVEVMDELQTLERKYFTRDAFPPLPLPPPKTEKKGTLRDITKSYHGLWSKQLTFREKETKKTAFDTLQQQWETFHYSAETQQDVLRRHLQKGPVHFPAFYSTMDSSEEIITTFCAILELSKQQEILIDRHPSHFSITPHMTDSKGDRT